MRRETEPANLVPTGISGDLLPEERVRNEREAGQHVLELIERAVSHEATLQEEYELGRMYAAQVAQDYN